MRISMAVRTIIGAVVVMTTLGLTAAPAFAYPKPPDPITFTSTPPAHPVVGDNYSVSATSKFVKPVTIGVTKSSNSVCTVTPTTSGEAIVTFVGSGKCVIYAAEAGTYKHLTLFALQVVVVASAKNYRPYPPLPANGSGKGSCGHGGHLVSYHHHSVKRWGHDAKLVSATLPIGPSAQSSSSAGVTLPVALAAVAVAFGGMFLLRTRRRSRATGRAN